VSKPVAEKPAKLANLGVLDHGDLLLNEEENT
jgi:hypothetical protein